MWIAKGDELLTNLLVAIAADVGYKFDRVQLKKGVYSPIAHGELELDQTMLRKLAIKMLSGKNRIKMDVTSFPADEDVLKSQAALQTALGDALTGKGSLNVTVKGGEPKA